MTGSPAVPRPVLVVEDNRDDARLARHVLAQAGMGHLVHLVRDGREAADYLFGLDAGPRAAALRLALLDIKLPGMDGLELLRRMREELATRSVPVVMFTSSDQARDRWAAYRLGANSYVVKPVGFDDLSHTLERVVRYWLEVNRPPPAQGSRPPEAG
ncbi:MAG: response regulator [Longimicrobiales bacterium]|nr:response regulator [Longimicrobiales bacterium]